MLLVLLINYYISVCCYC